METLRRKHIKVVNGKRTFVYVDHSIYHKDDKEAQSLNYKPWYECEKGDWGISSDGYIAECLDAKIYKVNRGRTKWVKFPYGSSFYRLWKKDQSAKLFYEKHRDNRAYNSVSCRPYWESWKRQTHYQAFVKAYVIMLMKGKIDYNALGRILEQGNPNPWMLAKQKLKTKAIQNMIDKELERVLVAEGVTRKAVIRMLKEAAAIARKKRDATNMLRAAEDFVDIYRMKDKQAPIRELPGNYSVSDAEDIARLIDAEKDHVKKLAANTENEDSEA